MKTKYFLLFIVLLSLSCKAQTKSAAIDSLIMIDKVYRTNEEVYSVSMIKLLANPERYNGKRIILHGYLNLEFEGNALYFHKDDYLQNILKNSVWVNLNDKIAEQAHKYNKAYVTILGTFDNEDTGHMGVFGGGLKNITNISISRSRDN